MKPVMPRRRLKEASMIVMRLPRDKWGKAWRAMIEIAPVRLVAADPIYEVLPEHIELLSARCIAYELIVRHSAMNGRGPHDIEPGDRVCYTELMSKVLPARWIYFDRKPGSVYRQLFIKGRNIAARTLYTAFLDQDDPRTMEQIASDFEVPLAAVQEAVAYCESDPPEFLQDWEMEESSIRARTKPDTSRAGTAAPSVPSAGADTATPLPRP
jgi:hypothetical protein